MPPPRLHEYKKTPSTNWSRWRWEVYPDYGSEFGKAAPAEPSDECEATRTLFEDPALELPRQETEKTTPLGLLRSWEHFPERLSRCSSILFAALAYCLEVR